MPFLYSLREAWNKTISNNALSHISCDKKISIAYLLTRLVGISSRRCSFAKYSSNWGEKPGQPPALFTFSLLLNLTSASCPTILIPSCLTSLRGRLPDHKERVREQRSPHTSILQIWFLNIANIKVSLYLLDEWCYPRVSWDASIRTRLALCPWSEW